MDDLICHDVRDHIATIRFNRADKLNAYTPAMGEAVVAAFGRAKQDSDTRVVILTGGGRAFCAGVDLDFFKAHMSGQDTGAGPKLGEESFVRSFPLELVDFPKPVIAAINGPAYGVGVTMTLGCDVRLAASNAEFGLNFTSLGVLPGLGSTHLLPQLVGLPKALELVLSAATISAQVAQEIGLVQGIYEPRDLQGEARRLAAKMAEARPEVLAAAKHALRHGADASMAEAMAEEQRLSRQLNAKGKA